MGCFIRMIIDPSSAASEVAVQCVKRPRGAANYKTSCASIMCSDWSRKALRVPTKASRLATSFGGLLRVADKPRSSGCRFCRTVFADQWRWTLFSCSSLSVAVE